MKRSSDGYSSVGSERSAADSSPLRRVVDHISQRDFVRPQFVQLLNFLVLADSSLSQVNATLEDPSPEPSSKRRVTFCTVEASLPFDVPSPNNRSSAASFEAAHGALESVVASASLLRISVEIPDIETTLQELKCNIQHFERTEERKAADYLIKELGHLCRADATSLSQTVKRQAGILSSLVRHEMKLLLNKSATLTPGTGNLLQNYEDAAAVLHHSLNLISLGPPCRTLEEEISRCTEAFEPSSVTDTFTPILDRLSGVKGAAAFLKPVEELWPDLVDYRERIACPMDLGGIRSRLSLNQYSNMSEAFAHVRLIFNNCIEYNGLHSDMGKVASSMEKSFELELVRLLIEICELQSPRETALQCASDVISLLSARRFLADFILLPSVAEMLSAGDFSRLQRFAKSCVDADIEELRCFAPFADLQALRHCADSDLAASRTTRVLEKSAGVVSRLLEPCDVMLFPDITETQTPGCCSLDVP